MAKSKRYYERRNRFLARLIGLGRAQPYPFLSHWLFSEFGGAVGDALKWLIEKGFVQVVKRGIPGGISYAVLTEKGCGAFGFSKERATPLGGAALTQHVQINAACVLLGHRCFRVENGDPELVKQIGRLPHNAFNIVTDEFEGGPVLLRTFSCSDDTQSAVKQLRSHIRKGLKVKRLASLIRAGDFGFSVLCISEEARTTMEGAVCRLGLLTEAPRIVCWHVPDAEGLAAFLRRLRHS